MEQYKAKNAKYAVGAPTLEILAASFYDSQIKDMNTLIIGVNSGGYPTIID